ncbi:Myo-inositol 2-dehydrogenase [Thermogutta terrifontis]|mgnify:CR=1 FL=1|jgi:predicted dehydrogenase|uniref:Myo-inositol 2-dehydrogenase n=1 Tax=Thermogutta terrifontis TaxID=1331910 RepID=A0A286RI88_9BACT|nr:Gfo/Idh/MocA family oxidoreductase [Thermogutta terrifontis]ASV75656.1 Myo-inositol 2-dehydrogenase [Thermogutta terrifontis]
MSDVLKTSRRSFLETSAVVGGAALMGSLNLARSVHAAGSDVLKVCLVGCGGRGNGAVRDHIQASQKTGIKVQVVAVADAFEDRARNTAENLRKEFGKDIVDLPDDRVFVGLDAYKKAIDCGVDIMINASPPGFRPFQYEYAIKAGKHVFMEKPVCVDAPGFRKVMAANKLADEKGLKVGVGLQRHHQASYIEEIGAIKEGKIGEIMFLRAYWNGGAIWIRRRQPGQNELQYQVYNWYHFTWLSGDNIVEQHVHNLDVCNWVMSDDLTNPVHPIEANGMGGCEMRYRGENRGVGQIYDHHFVEFTYPNGVKMYSQCRQINGCWNIVAEAAHGTKGVSPCSAGGRGGTNPYVQEHIDFLNAIVKNEKYNEGYFGATSSFTAVLGRMATYSGKVVRWDEAVEKGPVIAPEITSWDQEPPVKPDANGDYPIAQPGVYEPY